MAPVGISGYPGKVSTSNISLALRFHKSKVIFRNEFRGEFSGGLMKFYSSFPLSWKGSAAERGLDVVYPVLSACTIQLLDNMVLNRIIVKMICGTQNWNLKLCTQKLSNIRSGFKYISTTFYQSSYLKHEWKFSTPHIL